MTVAIAVQTNRGRYYMNVFGVCCWVVKSPDERVYVTDGQLDAEIWCWLDAARQS